MLESEGRQKEVSKYLMHHAKYLMIYGRVWKKVASNSVRKSKVTNGLGEPLRFKGTLESETIWSETMLEKTVVVGKPCFHLGEEMEKIETEVRTLTLAHGSRKHNEKDNSERMDGHMP